MIYFSISFIYFHIFHIILPLFLVENYQRDIEANRKVIILTVWYCSIYEPKGNSHIYIYIYTYIYLFIYLFLYEASLFELLERIDWWMSPKQLQELKNCDGRHASNRTRPKSDADLFGRTNMNWRRFLYSRQSQKSRPTQEIMRGIVRVKRWCRG